MTGHRKGGAITPPVKFTTTGYQWHCETQVPGFGIAGRHEMQDCDDSAGGFETDFRRIWKDARAHKDEHPDHEVIVDRWQRSVIEAPSRTEGGADLGK